MSIGTTAAVLGGVGLAGGLASSVIGASSASNAASEQEQASQAAIAEQEREFNTTQANEAPWLTAGQGALSMLSEGLAPGGSLVAPNPAGTYQAPAPYTQAAFEAPAPFVAPTGITMENDPAYQTQLAAGQQALTRGALASGGAFSGGTMQALQQAGQNYANTAYQNVYNNALTGYQTNFGSALNAYNSNATAGLNAYNTNANTALNSYQTQFNAANTNQSNLYNRIAALSGVGQTTASQLATAGQASTNNVTNLLTQGGNAAAAGTLGVGSSINTGIQSSLNSYMNGTILNSLMNGGGYNSGAFPTSGSGYTVTPSSLGGVY